MFHYFDNVVGALSVVLVVGSRVVGRYHGAVGEYYWRVVLEVVVEVDSCYFYRCYFYIDYFHHCCCTFELLSYLMLMVVENVHLAVVEVVVVAHSYRNTVVVAVAMVAGALGLDIGMNHHVVVGSCILEKNCLQVDAQEVEGAVYNSHHNAVEGANIDFFHHPSVDH